MDASFPRVGTGVDELLERIAADRVHDLDWRGGRAFSLVYDVDEPEVERLLHTVAASFLHENALNPFRYRTLLAMESDLLAMSRDLFGGAAASLTSGGTESLFLAVQSARDDGRTRGVERPRLLCCDTAHPAIAKACHYLDVEEVRLPHGPDGRAQPDAFADAMGSDVVLVVASAPCYPFGVIDPVAELAGLAAEHGTLCHVDACLGGWLLPWWEQLGQPVPAWDLRVPGVTSLSADIHKYGYCFKGASVLLYRERDLYQRQIFMFDRWPGGLYASSGAAGTRPGAPIAAAWAVIQHLGADGYTRLARRVLDATERIRAGIHAIDGLSVHHRPDLSLFEFGSAPRADGGPGPDIGAVGDVMDDRGWNLDRQQGGLHLMLSPGHDRVVEEFLSDLSAAAATDAASRGAAHTYGGVV